MILSSPRNNWRLRLAFAYVYLAIFALAGISVWIGGLISLWDIATPAHTCLLHTISTICSVFAYLFPHFPR